MSAFIHARLMRRLAGPMLFCIAMAHAMATTWPQVGMPANASVYQVDSVVVVDGLPVKMQGFVSPQTQAEVAAWFRRSLGKDLVENRLGNKLILGQARGEYFISIQLESMANATRAIVAVAHLKAGIAQRPEAEAANKRLLARMPGGTRVISRLGSVDGPRNATHVILTNSYEEQFNGDELVRMLREDGMKLEHQADGAKGHGKTLFFKGKGSEAMAVLSRDMNGNTTIVLNITTFMEQYK